MIKNGLKCFMTLYKKNIMIIKKKYIDKKTGAKIRIFLFKIPSSFFHIMTEKAKIINMTNLENYKSYIHFLEIKSKYYTLINIEKTQSHNKFVELKFKYEKLTNKLSYCV